MSMVDGDDELQLRIRTGLYHLMAVGDAGESAVGARGITGHAYRGHVFWDADLFVLPFLAATHPAAARSMLEYRLRRLPAARAAARAEGNEGARFAWESAETGFDVTPTSGRDRTGRVVPIRTGFDEVHIVGDVAWAACCYIGWSGDEQFANGPGRELLVETARYWASRIRVDGSGFAHLYGVIGPDEYHEPVDDNAFTNVLARWNLRVAADSCDSCDSGGRGVVALEERARVGAPSPTRWSTVWIRRRACTRSSPASTGSSPCGSPTWRRAGRSPPTCCSGGSASRERRS